MGSRDRLQGDLKVRLTALLAEAHSKRLWIYDKPGKQWYTPEEFEPVAEHVGKGYCGGDAWLIMRDFELQDPRLGMHSRIRNIEAAVKEARVFEQKVFDYYYKK